MRKETKEKKDAEVGAATKVVLSKWTSQNRMDTSMDTEEFQSRNTSFVNPNYEYLIDLYNTDANKKIKAKWKPLILNNQLFSKRVKMVNASFKQKEVNKRRNKSVRSSLNWSKSLK